MTSCGICGQVIKNKNKFIAICNHCHKVLHTNTYAKINDIKYQYERNMLKYSRAIEKYKPELIDLVHSMKNFKVGQIVRMKKVAKFRDSYFHSRDMNILSTFINKIGEIRRIGRLGDTRRHEKFIEVRFILPNMKKRDILCVRRELTDATDEEKKEYMELKEGYEAREVAKKI